ncbi:aldo/keto reductase [Pseudoalteromonas ruthenica]|uniref:aldo/keto reductase n=1 Tax=Pseudoalteromonas ruthenica TaxID=151081 RepID=UPI00110BFD02|nr:aldo/keto reductase [Pseudoalteromonas ruthenica]TMO84564.1 oxidoreductase [Pseudoalteromonas ruthenica]TMP21194.1 oxidoreductase [Pseudoalteromonas ruthenica]
MAHRTISPLVLGFWRMLDWQRSAQQNLAFVEQCIEQGIVDTDHADIYGQYRCEAAFGELLKLKPSVREQIRIITKCGIALQQGKRAVPGHVNHYNSSREHIIASAEKSLQHFHTDRLDCLLIHRPDYLMQADEVAEAFNTLRARGDVLHFGVSNFTTSQFELLQSRLDFPLQTNQIEFSPYQMNVLDDGTLDQCQRWRINPMCWSPLAGGEIFTSMTEKAQRLRQTLEQIAQEIGASGLDQVVYAWLLKHPSQPAVVLGTGNIDRIRSAIGAQLLELSHEQWYRIWQASKGHAVP